MSEPIKVAILDDHQSIIDGYAFRLQQDADIEIVATILYGEELEPTLARHKVDVLILDVEVPISAANHNPYPLMFLLPQIQIQYPNLSVIVISMHTQRTLIRSLINAGASGYILKDDSAALRSLASVVRTIAGGGIFLSERAFLEISKLPTGELGQPLSARQLEALSLCAAYPNAKSGELAEYMKVASSTMRNLLSNAYLKLNVRTRAAAVTKARQLGLITPENPSSS